MTQRGHICFVISNCICSELKNFSSILDIIHNIFVHAYWTPRLSVAVRTITCIEMVPILPCPQEEELDYARLFLKHWYITCTYLHETEFLIA